MARTSLESDSEMRRLIGELLELGPRRGVARLIAKFKDAMQEEDIDRFTVAAQALYVQSASWVSELRKRAAKRGKCPPALKRSLQRALETIPSVNETHATITAHDVLRQARSARSKAELVIEDKSELGFGRGYRQFLAKLHTIRQSSEPPIDLRVRIKCNPVYVHGLALLAAWCERNAAHVQLSADSPEVERYLDSTGYRKIVEKMVSIDAPEYDGYNHVALTMFDREDKHGADLVAGRITDLFTRHAALEKDASGPLKTVLAELIENVYRHANSNSASFVMAQAFPKPRKLHLVIADTGIGILASFRDSKSPAVSGRVKDDRAAIEMALSRLVTSKVGEHAGYGLFVVQRLAERNQAQFRITSGRATKEFGMARIGWERSRYQGQTLNYLPWRGTEISLIFNLDRPLPLVEVYQELGPQDRQEDFFD